VAWLYYGWQSYIQQRVAAAMLVATNPCFVSRDGWDCAVDQSVFKQFATDLEKNQQKTIRRFLALQVKGYR
jgi:pimeloyl-[acyl-carrier protein] methyl ester esterase